MSAIKTIVFAGPSLPPSARPAKDVVWAPPVRRGDLKACAEFDVVIILDGEFGQNLSVSPKEILALIADGKEVIGASSMGALRASELNLEGMRGTGWVYEWLSKPGIRQDDDVALVYSPLNFWAFTVPMVNVEYLLHLPQITELLSVKERACVSKRCRRIFYADRTPDRVEGVLREVVGAERCAAIYCMFAGELPDIKRVDAVAAVEFAHNA